MALTSTPKIRKLVLPFIALLCVAALVSVFASRQPRPASTLDDGPRVVAPRDTRIKVQVLNASRIPGQAARAVRYLRDRGFDVVESGNTDEQLETTLVLDRSGKGEFARLVALAFGVPHARLAPDTSRFVDVTVKLGTDWTPPLRSLNP